MTSSTQTIQLPENRPLFEWTAQDVVHEINENGRENEDEQNAISEFLSSMTRRESYRLMAMIDNQFRSYDNHTTDIFGESCQELARDLMEAIRAGDMPQPSQQDNELANRRRLDWNLMPGLTIQDAIESGGNEPLLREALLMVIHEEQASTDQAISEIMEEHQAEIEDFQARMKGKLLNELPGRLGLVS